MSSPSTAVKVNYLVMRYLHFRNARGDLQEGHVYAKRLRDYASRCQFPLFPVPIPVFPSTKSGFLCFFGLRNPHFWGFRAQNRGFCAFLAFGTPIFGLFEYKIGIFVSEWAIFPGFWAFRAQNRHFCARRGCNASCIWRFVSELRCLKRCVSGCCI